jgi:hypothetical protein
MFFKYDEQVLVKPLHRDFYEVDLKGPRRLWVFVIVLSVVAPMVDVLIPVENYVDTSHSKSPKGAVCEISAVEPRCRVVWLRLGPEKTGPCIVMV